MVTDGKKKTIAYVVCLLVMAFLSIVATIEYSAKIYDDKPDSAQLLIDGADFTPLVDTMKDIGRSMVDYVTFLSYGFWIVVLALIVFCVLYNIALKRQAPEKGDFRRNFFILLGFFIVATLICFAILRFNELSSAIIINIGWTLIAFLFVVLPARKKK